jgi:anaerobic ribonucleoside-triphosphate reductase activating protein
MKIASTQYNLQNKSFEIYLSGCKGNCNGCYNPELKDFTVGKNIDKYYINTIINKINEFKNLIDSIWVLGGDPLDQKHLELIDLIYDLKYCNKEIWLWTRYDLNKIPCGIKGFFDYIKCGEYINTLSCDDNIQFGIKLSTSNQKIYKKGLDY